MRGWPGRRFVRRPAVITVRGGVADGLVMGTAHASADYAQGTNELPVQEAVRDRLSPGGVFYDVGANVGFFALMAARIVGEGGAVYAFEPLPRIATEARANAERNGFTNIQVIEAAVSDRDGRATLVVTGHPGGASLSEADANVDATGTVTVTTVRLDTLVESGAIRPPDVVKVDVEGVEPEVVEGLRATLLTHRPTVVCELDAATKGRVAEKVSRLTAVLADLGYAVSELPRWYEDTAWHVVHLVATPD